MVTVLMLGTLQYLAPPSKMHWVYVLQRLYYIPTVLAGLTMGWRVGLGIALLAGTAFVIGTPSIWTVSGVDAMDQCLEVCVFCLVGARSGVLTDRDRRQQATLRKTSNQLRQAHQELEKNFERMKRAERIYALAQLSAGRLTRFGHRWQAWRAQPSLCSARLNPRNDVASFSTSSRKRAGGSIACSAAFSSLRGPRQPDLKMVDIGEVLDSDMILVRQAGDTSRFELQKDVQSGLPMLECDPEQLKQVLLNLVMNASQAMPQGGTVLLGAQRNGTSVNIDVHDQGGGISEGNLDRIFDPFFTTKETGTGLGLSVAHGIVSQHKGLLTIARNSRQGVTVRVSLPLQPGQI